MLKHLPVLVRVVLFATLVIILLCSFVLIIGRWLVLHSAKDVGDSRHLIRVLLKLISHAIVLESQIVHSILRFQALDKQRDWILVRGLNWRQGRLKFLRSIFVYECKLVSIIIEGIVVLLVLASLGVEAILGALLWVHLRPLSHHLCLTKSILVHACCRTKWTSIVIAERVLTRASLTCPGGPCGVALKWVLSPHYLNY